MNSTNTIARKNATPPSVSGDHQKAGTAAHSAKDRMAGSTAGDAVRVKTKIDASSASPLDEGLDGTFPASDPVSATRR